MSAKRILLRLYVAEGSPDSSAALANLNVLVTQMAQGRPEVVVEVVDVAREPDKAAVDGILVTPTLLRVSPSPGCRIIGNLSHTEALGRLLGLVSE